MINQSLKLKNNKILILKEAEVEDAAELIKYVRKVACERVVDKSSFTGLIFNWERQ